MIRLTIVITDDVDDVEALVDDIAKRAEDAVTVNVGPYALGGKLETIETQGDDGGWY